MICCFTLVLGLAVGPVPSLQAQTNAAVGDWQTVERIPIGTKIKVVAINRRNFGNCFLDRVTDDELDCTTRGHFGFENRYRRSDVGAVYLGQHTIAIGIGVGAAAGATLGALHPGDVSPRGFVALEGAGAGALFGGVLGLFADPFVHGRLVYRVAGDTYSSRRREEPQGSD
jgi:hypothetical protein